MGKKRVVKKAGEAAEKATVASSAGKLKRKRLESGVLHVQATFNNTLLALTDSEGGAVVQASSGALGFKGAKKGTPFAAAKVGELLGERGKLLGVKEVSVIVRGVGAGRESSIRGFIGKSGAVISSIRDRTPVPYNGPRPRKARRV